MEEFYKYTGWFFAIIFGGIGGVGGVGLLINHFAQARVKFYFDKQLDQHRHNLAIITKHAEYDISKKLYDFEAYASKKHEIYPELYRLAAETWHEILRFRYKFDTEIKSSMRGLDGEELVEYFYERIAPLTIKNLDAYEYVFKNELYLSKNVSIAYNEALSEQADFTKRIDISFQRNYKKDDWRDSDFWSIDIDEEIAKADEKMRILKETIYEELSYTHSEEAEKKEEALS